ncbi:MAG: ATP-binding protein [Bernardetiaceae bacterium]|nr:ATP-binding protein [Bernardetiaceae bacterium]
MKNSDSNFDKDYIKEAAALLFAETLPSHASFLYPQASVKQNISGFAGAHSLLDEDGNYHLDYNAFMQKMQYHATHTAPLYRRYHALRQTHTKSFAETLRLQEFMPKVLSSFVRNRLINELYLPIIGDNLAKQIGTVGENKRTDLMGLLLLISPPGYGKTTLMEYVASRLGIIFMKINGPAIGHQVTSLDPDEAPNVSAREEVNKINLALEMGDNVMIYLDDIQHCNPELLQKFISLCDGQRRMEGVYKGKSKTYDLRGKKVAVVMAGNPYTESGDKFQIPDMLANRADTYNLGDIIGDTEAAFRMSYIENCLTSNPTLNPLAARSRKDIYQIIRIAETDMREGASFEESYSAEELNAYISVLKKLFTVRDTILNVNLEYIRSAAQSDDYREEPPFKLQGSYRNMNKIAEKIAPIMNEQELRTLIVSHYENESQTLTSGAEANLLKFKQLNGLLSEEEAQRWESIKETFRKNNAFKGMGLEQGNEFALVIAQMSQLGDGLLGIQKALTKK